MLNQLKALVSVKASSFKRTLERGMEKLLGLRYLSLKTFRLHTAAKVLDTVLPG